MEGTLCFLYFRIPENVGQSTTCVTVHDSSFKDSEGTVRAIDIMNGTVNLIGKIGDINNDEITDDKDLEVLIYYYAGYPEYESMISDLDAADVDGDGAFTRKDTMILARYLEGWNGYTLPYGNKLN